MQIAMNSERRSLSVLITNIALAGRSGTEIVTRDLALGLLRRGHRPVVYTQSDGAIAQELRNASIPVVTRIEEVGDDIDIIHGHHAPVAATAICRFPAVPAVFVAHDAVSWQDAPPQFPSIKFYVAVDTTVAERLAAGIEADLKKLRVVLNAVDTDRFRPGPRLNARPNRALAFAKNHGHVEAIRSACLKSRIAVDFIGQAVGNVVDAPEEVLNQYDLVFASALSALEAMACGRAVIVCDGRGMAGGVTLERAQLWRPKNFGLRTLTRPTTEAALIEEIQAYDPSQSASVGEFIRDQSNQGRWLDEIEGLHREALAEHATGVLPDAALATARHMERWSPRLDARWPWLAERQNLVAENELLAFGSPRPRLGVKCRWNMTSRPSAITRLRGFSTPEDWGTWVAARFASARVRLPDVEQGQDLQLSFEFIPFVPRPKPALEVDVIINGIHVATWGFRSGDHTRPIERHIVCPASQLHDEEYMWVSFNVRNARSPLDCGISSDGRLLSIGMVGLTFTAIAS